MKDMQSYEPFEISEEIKQDILNFARRPIGDYSRPSTVYWIGGGNFSHRIKEENEIEEYYTFCTKDSPSIEFKVVFRYFFDFDKNKWIPPEKCNWRILKVEKIR